MNAFVRQITVLSVLWAVCELLLPDGKHQQMVRMTASLLVMMALLTTASQWLGGERSAQPAMTGIVHQVSEDTYQRTALTALANQLENYCVRMAQRAGYQANAAVYLTMEGTLDHIQLAVTDAPGVLVSSSKLRQMLAQQLGVEEDRIWLSVEGV